MKTNKFLMGALFCAFVAGLTGCNGNDPEQNGSNVTKLDKSSGCLNGSFSVAKGKYVRFSMGNLQYTQSTQTWSFAKNQYDMIGTDNVIKVEDEYGYDDYALADKIDLFGWSGSTTTAKWGISISEDYIDYSGDFKDWGQNVISNGGNKANQWRTLTYGEWEYLIEGRANASSLQVAASVNGVNGLILLPDGWKQPNGVSFKSGYSYGGYDDYQSFTAAEWQKLEKSGAVFLPSSGYRVGTDVNYVGLDGSYWSATPVDDIRARYLRFTSNGANLSSDYRDYRPNGQAVRLVRDVK